MGQNHSLPKTMHRKSLKSPFPRRSKSHQSALSHTFNLLDSEDKIELLNVNIATEEELMTLPGINREIARNIVDHRKAIGRFKKVEDLALVRGIGADKLEVIRPEICVSKRLSSRASSRAASFDSLKSQDSKSTVKTSKSVNVNKATAFELQNVHGITQEIAAGIVEYRNRKGPFRRVDDLIKVKRIDRMRLGNISQFLTVEEDNADRPISNGTTNNHRNCNGSAPKQNGINGLQNSSVYDLFELLSAYSPRPVLEERFEYKRDREDAFRVAVWNLHKFSYEKAGNLGVREIVCRTILENGWSIIAVQEIEDVRALQMICDELNRPKLRRVNEWTSNSRQWSFSVLDTKTSGLGFLFETVSGDKLIELTTIKNGPKELIKYYESADGAFRIGELNIHVVNTKLTRKVSLSRAECTLDNFVNHDDVYLFVGDFVHVSNGIDFENAGKLLELSKPIPKSSENNHRPLRIFGNVRTQTQLTCMSGTVVDGLAHLAIPSGWNWGGEVSPFRPSWVELYANPNSGTAL